MAIDPLLWYGVTKSMRLFHQTCILAAAVSSTALCLYSQTPASKGAAPAVDAPAVAPRASSSDYQAREKAGKVTIAAEFKAHFVPTPLATYTTEDYVTIEVGLYGEEGARLTLSPGDFSIRINGKKNALPAQSFVLVMSSLKDPEWTPPESSSSSSGKSKTSINTGGGGGQSDQGNLPPIVHMPAELQHAMNVRVQKAALAEGDRALPQAGLLFFSYRGQLKGIQSVELLYKGPAGTATVALHP
jgi:hypothetical protein